MIYRNTYYSTPSECVRLRIPRREVEDDGVEQQGAGKYSARSPTKRVTAVRAQDLRERISFADATNSAHVCCNYVCRSSTPGLTDACGSLDCTACRGRKVTPTAVGVFACMYVSTPSCGWCVLR